MTPLSVVIELGTCVAPLSPAAVSLAAQWESLCKATQAKHACMRSAFTTVRDVISCWIDVAAIPHTWPTAQQAAAATAAVLSPFQSPNLKLSMPVTTVSSVGY